MPKIKVHPTDPTMFLYWDVAANEPNAFWVKPAGVNNSSWSWNKDFEKPTVTPSILNTSSKHENWQTGEITSPWRNHIFIREGKIQYLSDCTHTFAGQTVDMVDFPDDW